MLIVLIIVEVLLCIWIVFKVPAYGLGFGSLTALLACGMAYLASPIDRYTDGTWMRILLLFCVFIGVGFWRIAVKRRVRRKTREQEAAEWQDQISKSAAYELGFFVEQSEDIRAEIRRVRARMSGEFNATPEDVIILDAIRIIRSIALAKDEIRAEDAASLRMLAYGATHWNITSKSDTELVSLIEEAEDGAWVLLPLMLEAESQAAVGLSERLVAFANEVGRFPKRRKALQEALEALRVVTTVPEQAKNTVYVLLGVEPGSSQQQIKAAYRAKVRKWHPDQLEQMAPELRAFANQELTRINAAYEELTARA